MLCPPRLWKRDLVFNRVGGEYLPARRNQHPLGRIRADVDAKEQLRHSNGSSAQAVRALPASPGGRKIQLNPYSMSSESVLSPSRRKDGSPCLVGRTSSCRRAN